MTYENYTEAYDNERRRTEIILRISVPEGKEYPDKEVTEKFREIAKMFMKSEQ